jgi:hypothetical protein
MFCSINKSWSDVTFSLKQKIKSNVQSNKSLKQMFNFNQNYKMIIARIK